MKYQLLDRFININLFIMTRSFIISIGSGKWNKFSIELDRLVPNSRSDTNVNKKQNADVIIKVSSGLHSAEFALQQPEMAVNKKGKYVEKPIVIDNVEDLSNYYKFTEVKAAERLKMTINEFRVMCNKLGLSGWPHDKYCEIIHYRNINNPLYQHLMKLLDKNPNIDVFMEILNF